MNVCALKCVIPVPRKVFLETGFLPLCDVRTVSIPVKWKDLGEKVIKDAGHYGIHLEVVPEHGDLRIQDEQGIGLESWKLQVSHDGLVLSAGDASGAYYGLEALRQMIAAASAKGPAVARLECGRVEDGPRFGWRALMLDSARHFQTVATVKAVIRIMSAYRLNVLHWHLTDNQGWRLGTGMVSPEASLNSYSDGTYSRQDLEEIVSYAKAHFVQIVPEIDVPGHSRGLIAAYPELGCDTETASPKEELCIGNPKTLSVIKDIFKKLFEIFPDSHYIHVGGDEAEVSNWNRCPHCQEAMKAGKFKDMRGLENHFMRELTQFIMDNGRIPISWGTGTAFQPGVVIQNWLDIRESLKHAANGCKVIMSVHTSYYLDYPAEPCEPQETWMFALPPEAIYMADPYVIWEKEQKDSLLGPETCLWTERVPEWRVIPKILPRIGAFAETAWSLPEHKDWYDFKRRTDFLRCSGYEEDLRRDR